MAEFVLGALAEIWGALAPQNLRLAMMGGLALSAWKHVRATRDIDFLIAVEPPSVDVLIAELRAAGLEPKRHPIITQVGDVRFIQFSFRPAESSFALQVDFLLADSEYHRTALNRCAPAAVPGLELEIAVLACEDLILHKLIAGRMIDRADSVALLSANRAKLDVHYLNHWASELGVETDLAEVWREALPEEPNPPAS